MNNRFVAILDHDRILFCVLDISVVRTVEKRVLESMIKGRNIQCYTSKVKSYQELVGKVYVDTCYEYTPTLNY